VNHLNTLAQNLNGLTALERIGWVLLQSLWQNAIVAASLALALVCLRRRTPQMRYVIACAALLLMAALPLATAVLAFSARPLAAESASFSASAHPIVAVPDHPTLSTPPVVTAPPDRFTTILRAASYSWIFGIALLSTWNLLGWLRVRRVRIAALPISGAWPNRLPELAAILRIGGDVALRVSDHLSTPAVVGWLRPVILVPASALTDLPPSYLDALLLHELAHVRRHDYLVNLLQTMIETLLFYHPAVWWCGSVIRTQREHCCDDIAAQHCGSAILYAHTLAAIEQLRAPALPGWALGATGGSLLRRIERLVGSPTSRANSRPAAMSLTMLLIVLACGLVAIGRRSGFAQLTTLSADVRASAPAESNSVQPADLIAGPVMDYTISPNDMLSIQIAGLNSPNSETLKQARVSEKGDISMPYLENPIRAVGLTEIGLEKAIVKAYREAGLMQQAQVSVTITEARGRSYNILGAVAAPASYPITFHDFRLLDAIAAAGGTTSNPGMITVLRRQPDQTDRKIEVPGRKLVFGDSKFNLVIQPHDTIFVAAEGDAGLTPVRIVHLIVGQSSLLFQGNTTTWHRLDGLIANLPDRPNTVLRISPLSEDVTIGHFFDAQNRAGQLVAKYGLKYLSQTGAPAQTAK
jgi:beta-lactamase regulating signal transducer with metallopeptidase domain/protein involved in polysaccharide export with SLBB domain